MLRALLHFLFSVVLFAQTPLFDGVVNEEEWRGAQQFTLDYEIEPSNNGVAQYKTDVFVTHSETDIYVGFSTFLELSENIADEVLALLDAESAVNSRWGAFTR